MKLRKYKVTLLFPDGSKEELEKEAAGVVELASLMEDERGRRSEKFAWSEKEIG